MYKYGMKFRPLSIGCQPKGHIKYVESNKSESGFHGFVFYENKLSDKELNKFELSDLNNKYAVSIIIELESETREDAYERVYPDTKVLEDLYGFKNVKMEVNEID